MVGQRNGCVSWGACRVRVSGAWYSILVDRSGSSTMMGAQDMCAFKAGTSRSVLHEKKQFVWEVNPARCNGDVDPIARAPFINPYIKVQVEKKV